MSYTIYKSDGSAVVIPDNTIDIAYYNPTANGAGKGLGTQLIGRNATNYGIPVAQNFLQITENFASTAVPLDGTSLQGQLWFNKTSTTTGSLYVRISSASSGGILNWKKVVTEDNSGNSTVTGNLTVDGSITSRGSSVPVLNPITPLDGDIQVVGSVISIYANGAYHQIFPAVYL